VLRTRWPWLGAGIAALIWAPNVVWQATHGWPQLAMAAALHQSGSTPSDYAAGVPAQLVFAGLLVTPLVIAGYVRLWRATELGFLAVTCTLLVIYVLVWVPGRQYYAEGTVAVVLAAGAAAAEGWAARGRPARRTLRTRILVAAPLVGMAVLLPAVLPIVPGAERLHRPADRRVYRPGGQAGT
jgi:hypothetical protein